MSIYHCSISIISRANGSSSVASSAYRGCCKLEDSTTGEVFDYSNKRGHEYSQMYLPDVAHFSDREELWNSIELIEKGANAQLSREFEVAFPIELSKQQRAVVLDNFCNKLKDQGMCVVADIHNPDKKETNPHAHIMTAMRSLDESGEWIAKSQKKYKVKDINSGNIQFMLPSELKENENYEKIYRYKKGKDYLELTISEALNYPDYKRVGRSPIDRKVTTNDWNDKERVEEWRSSWSKVCNEYLEEKHKIDHRSYERQGIEKLPTIHEGYVARKIERDGGISERCEMNRETNNTNNLLAELNNQLHNMKLEMIKRLRELGERLHGYNRTIRERIERSYGELKIIGATEYGIEIEARTATRTNYQSQQNQREIERRKQIFEQSVNEQIAEQPVKTMSLKDRIEQATKKSEMHNQAFRKIDEMYGQFSIGDFKDFKEYFKYKMQHTPDEQLEWFDALDQSEKEKVFDRVNKLARDKNPEIKRKSKGHGGISR